MKNIKNISEFARVQGKSRQVIQHRIKAGWLFGVLNGKRVMYSPKHVEEVKGEQ